jgi:hypothetical protein
MQRRRWLRGGLVLVGLAALLGLVGSAATQPATVPLGAVRPPVATTSMDTDPANLASAVLTHAFGQLPAYIDEARLRLLPLDVFRAFEPGRAQARTYRIVTPRTSLVLDTVFGGGVTARDAVVNTRNYQVAIALDGRRITDVQRYWVAYRNDGPQICRIYFPGDLGSLHMRVHSLVFRPLPAGKHVLGVDVVVRTPGQRPARIRTTYALQVLARGPNARERAIAPEEDAPLPKNSTPLALRGARG